MSVSESVTYSLLGHHGQQGGAGGIFSPGSPRTARGCWGPILSWVATDSKGVLGTYSLLGHQGQQWGAGDL